MVTSSPAATRSRSSGGALASLTVMVDILENCTPLYDDVQLL